ncbi:sialate O-acetylesterase [Haloferula sp. A504]|uniref:sialate O-acetylesterase n=1 Tax=Haloferula sp. A504 TaxID=3373601 RepID=UPI0031BE6AD8|nr:sialate O-acetylesterase [Verrucomicrobiaceae bacterium E54]
MKHLLLCLLFPVLAHADSHLFILSGQSNMAGLDPAISFTPTVEKAFGAENVVVVKSAQGGQPIRRWYKEWKPAESPVPEGNLGDLYDKLMEAVEKAAGDREFDTVTFVWMQGERDAREGHGGVYGDSFKGLIGQLSKDLKRDDIHFVIGRLSDFDMEDQRYPHWTKVRDVQVAVAESSPRGAWVDTDDLNDKPAKGGEGTRNDLHYTKEGYRILGERFAEAAIKLIRE